LFKVGGAIYEHQPVLAPLQDEDGVITLPSAYEKYLVTYEIHNNTAIKTIPKFFQAKRNVMRIRLQHQQRDKLCIKSNVWLECTYTNIEGALELRSFKTQNKPIYAATDIDEFLTNTFNKLLHEEEVYEGKKSGWTLYSIDRIT
jgi:hypothetical protein